MSYQTLPICRRLTEQGHAYLLRFFEQLDADQQDRFVKQLEEIDWECIQSLIGKPEQGIDWAERSRKAEPAPAIELSTEHSRFTRSEAVAAGEKMLADGKIAFALVAGGQGTRLGFDRPKGLFPIGPISEKSLFQILIEKAIGFSEFYGAPIPVLVMTSPVTHEETVRFLDAHQWFGLPSTERTVFCQGTMPAIDANSGQVLLSSKDQLALSPNGHGGMVEALARNHCIENLLERGVECLFYGQVDNPLLQVCDPLTLGYHRLLESEMTSQVVRKTSGKQRVGNVVSVEGEIQIIEYSDLPDDVAERKDANGNLNLWAGSIAVHVFEMEFLNRMAGVPDALPFHQASKKVPCLDENGNRLEPAEPNAIKFEKFIFDLLPHASNALAIEIDPQDGFAAVKNSAPATTETPETSKQAMVQLHRNWLESCGVHVEPGVDVEISPRFAIHARQLSEKVADTNTILEPTLFENSN